MTERKSPWNLGCFGVFWIFLLIVFSAMEIGGLLWLQPVWFESIAFWRPAPYPPEPIFLPASDSDYEFTAEANRQTVEHRVDLWEEYARQVHVDPRQNTEVETIEGTKIEFVAGSLDQAQNVTVTPVVRVPQEMVGPGGIPIGPLHDIRIGSATTYRFHRPVRISIPFQPDTIPPEFENHQLAIGTWEDDRWVPLPSRVDHERRTISADLPHASIEGIIVITGVTVGGIGVKFTETGRAIYEQLRHKLPSTYKTDNFAIHYDTSAGLGVPPDAEYPLSGGRAPGPHPLYVVDIGRYLEEARSSLPRVKMNVSAVSLYRWDVFLVPLSDFGASDLGGPVMLDNDFQANGEFMPNLDSLIRSTCIHELIHVAQDDYFNTFNAGAARWWLESTAEYLACRLMKLENRKTHDDGYYVSRETALLSRPFDLSEGLQPYAYASFFHWLDNHGLNSINIIRAVNDSGDASLGSLDRAIRQSGGESLSALFMDFAIDFYHNNLWSGSIVPLPAVASSLGKADAFNSLVRSGKGSGRIYTYSERSVPLTHLSATYFNFQAEGLKPKRGAKLVIHFPSGGESSAWPFALTGQMYGPGGYPLPGSPDVMLPIMIDEPGENSFVSRRIASPAGIPDEINQVSLILGNTSPDRDAGSVVVRRWLLMPPEMVTSVKLPEGKGYKVNWQTSDLKTRGGDKAFKGYNVYRRKKGETKFPKTPLNEDPITDEHYDDHPDDREDYVYTVSVVDILDHESLLAPIEDRDPFQGEWDGKFIFVKGEIAGPILEAFDGWNQKKEQKLQTRIQNARTPEQRSTAQKKLQAWHETSIEWRSKLQELVDKLEKILRLGIPISVKIQLIDGKYYIVASKVFYKALDEKDQELTEMVRNGERTLALKEQPENAPPLVLQLFRENEINQLYEGTYKSPEVTIPYTFRITLKRRAESVPE